MLAVLLLPVFAVAALGVAGGDDPARVGLALGMYGLTQACMQIPFGLASDRWGRRPVVLIGLLLFVLGSVICALSNDIFWITIGRAIQGSGAISAAITAWLADATRPEVRTRAMAMVGGVDCGTRQESTSARRPTPTHTDLQKHRHRHTGAQAHTVS